MSAALPLEEPPLLEARRLVKHFPLARTGLARSRAVVHAVEDVSLVVRAGETLGVVGESGCGKSTVARLLVRLLEPTSGEVQFAGRSLRGLSGRELRALRREMQIVFQDPYGSLDPRMRVGTIIAEGLEVHGIARGAAARERVAELLDEVGLKSEHARRYPHEFSGGQRQRIGIARALAVDPRFVVCDEPVSALDVSIQAQVINLLASLQDRRKLAYLFIAHDLRVVAHLSHRIAVMYLGRIVESGPTERLLEHPHHPYTRALLSAIPSLEPGAQRTRMVLAGDPPSATSLPAGCAFHPRCPWAEPRCGAERPELVAGPGGHAVACHVFPVKD